jgi:sigma-B regulation protein RsbU (phosphoserine phosphatase)
MKKLISEPVPAIEDLYHNAPCALISFYMDGKIITTNNTLLTWLDVAEDTICQHSFTDLIDKGGQFYYQLFVHPMLAMHGEIKEINIALKTPTGSIPCLLNATVAVNENGSTEKIVHAAIFKMDERKKYEAELLNKKVQAEREKQQKTATLEEVAFEQSHLVRLPLANIMGLISLVDKTALNDETKKLFTLMEQSVAQLDTEIRRIVDKTVS